MYRDSMIQREITFLFLFFLQQDFNWVCKSRTARKTTSGMGLSKRVDEFGDELCIGRLTKALRGEVIC